MSLTLGTVKWGKANIQIDDLLQYHDKLLVGLSLFPKDLANKNEPN